MLNYCRLCRRGLKMVNELRHHSLARVVSLLMIPNLLYTIVFASAWQHPADVEESRGARLPDC